MCKIALIVSISIALAIFSAEGKHRIVGGSQANANQFPYQVAIRHNGGQFCGGSIISQTKILTAAHCFNKITGPDGVTIKAGGIWRTQTESSEQIRDVSSVVKHANYVQGIWKDDIAILTLREPLTYNDGVKAISLPAEGSDVNAGTWLTASGWGTTSEAGSASENLLYVHVPVVDQTTCSGPYGSQITNSHVCAGSGGKDTCQGDSGGPLANADGTTIIGVTSFGQGCGQEGVPGVYTKVSQYRSWIQTYAGV